MLEENLFTKKLLQFDESGRFKVLMVSDIQESAAYDERTLRTLERLLDLEKPNLVIWGGDNCYGPDIHSKADFQEFLATFSCPMEQRNIPWAHVFGNHDHDLFLDDYWQQSAYEQYPYCVSKHSTGIHGVTNFLLPIWKHFSEEIGFAIWCMDTNNAVQDMNDLVPSGDMFSETQLPKMPVPGMIWDILRFDQLMWYWNSSVELEQYCGRKIPAMMCMHIAPYEYLRVAENAAEFSISQPIAECLAPGIFNSGLFAEILQRGDVRCLCCGHTHLNHFAATFCGVQLCYDACIGFSCYGDDDTRGGRVFEISQDDPWNIRTRMVYAKDLGAF